MRFLVLGPLVVTDGGGVPIPIAGSKERTVLADLIARAGRVVSVDDLIEDLWGEQPPRTAEKTLGSYVSRLRRALEPTRAAGSTSDVIVTRGNGYTLEVATDEVDSLRFEELAERGRRLLDSGRAEDAASALDEALGLWRGSAYQEYRYTGFGTSEGERLEELRRSAEEDRVDTRIAAGDASSLIADLEAMVRAEPLRERRWGQLMLALYRAGRQAEALHAFTRARSVLVDELGIEPGPDLSRLQTAILAQDPALEEPWSGSPTRAVSSTDVCPYKGLARFETSDAAFYFGREQVVSDAVGRLVGGRFLVLVGASGSGKSSILRAGLLHALESGAIPGSDRWSYALLRPGDHPMPALASALHAPAPHEPADHWNTTRRVLVVDQFEETFTACADDAERTAFLDAITQAALHPEGEVTIVLAMRADYYGRCAEHDALASLVAGNQILVGPMKTAELRRAIELPAERAALRVEDRLTDALIEHTVNQPGGLPLLSTALLELWTRRQDQTLHLDDYLRSGGVEGAVARMAERAFGGLDSNEQPAAKRILVRLAGSGDGTEVVGRAAPLSEFDLERDADASRAMAALTEARLITIAEGTVEVAHEALLRDWPRLRGWLEDDAEGRRLQRHVTESARAWDEGGRDDGDLYRGARLTAALDWADAHDPDLNTAEREYLATSRTASEGEVTRVRRTNRRIRGLLAGVAVLLVLSLIVGNLALGQRDSARAATDVADARLLAARSLTEKDLTVSLLLAREAVDLDDTAQTRSALLAALQRDPAAIAEMHANGSTPGDLTQWLRLSPDGHIIAAGGARTTVDFFDAGTYQELWSVDVGGATTTGAFSPDGGTLAVASVDHLIWAIDVSTRTPHSVKTGKAVDALLFAPQDGSLLSAESNGHEGFLVTRDPLTLEPSRPPVGSRSGPITAMDVSADGSRLVTTGLLPFNRPGPTAYTTLWSTRDLHRVAGPFPWGGNDVALSPDGRTAAIAVAQYDSPFGDDLKGRLVLLDLQTGDTTKSGESRRRSSGPSLGLTGVAFTADGHSVISTGDDHRILVWDSSSSHLRIAEAFDDPGGLPAFTPVLSPDGATLFTIDADGAIVAWDLTGGQSLGRRFTAGSGAPWNSGFPWFAVSPDGGRLAIVQNVTPSRRGSVRLVDTSTMESLHVLPLPFRTTTPGLAFSPDNKTLALTSFGGYVQLWDVRTGRREGRPFAVPVSSPDEVNFWTTAFSPDGSTLATAGSMGPNGVVFLWEVATGQLIRRLPDQEGTVFAVNFSPDGGRLVLSAGVHNGGDAIVWNVEEGRVERTIPADDSGVFWADISNDGTTLVTGGQSGERLWNLSTGDPIGSPISSLPAFTVDLSPDGRTLVAAGAGWVTVTDVATGSILGRSWFPGLEAKERLAALFAPVGHRLFIVSATGDAWVWNMDPASWEARACQIAGRNLSEAEWSVNLPDRPYEPSCRS
jgi:WD40 repeat protein/DNA-binding SARP family transcriptional activator/energy-coupling factor transporter ATP-binding protein EcfA2